MPYTQQASKQDRKEYVHTIIIRVTDPKLPNKNQESVSRCALPPACMNAATKVKQKNTHSTFRMLVVWWRV